MQAPVPNDEIRKFVQQRSLSKGAPFLFPLWCWFYFWDWELQEQIPKPHCRTWPPAKLLLLPGLRSHLLIGPLLTQLADSRSSHGCSNLSKQNEYLKPCLSLHLTQLQIQFSHQCFCLAEPNSHPEPRSQGVWEVKYLLSRLQWSEGFRKEVGRCTQ